MITQSEFNQIMLWTDEQINSRLKGWGVIHCVKWVGDMQRAMAQHAKHNPYEKNVYAERYLFNTRKVEMWAYESFVRIKKKEFYQRDATYLGRQSALKSDIRNEWAKLCREYFY